MLIDVKKVTLLNKKFGGPEVFNEMDLAIESLRHHDIMDNNPGILDCGYFKVKVEFCEHNNDD